MGVINNRMIGYIMKSKTMLLKKGDFEKRLMLFLEFRELRNEFTYIDQSEKKNLEDNVQIS